MDKKLASDSQPFLPKMRSVVLIRRRQSLSPLHNRMPAILDPEAIASWLDPEKNPKELLPLLHSVGENILGLYPVSKCVNKPGNEGEKSLVPIVGPA